jgi:cephalosporin hydroxylase
MDKSKFDELFNSEPAPLQESHELQWLISKVEKLNPLKVIVEVGIDKGGTLKFWDSIMNKGTIIGIDINNAIGNYYITKSNNNLMFIFQDSTLPSTLEKLKKCLAGKTIDFLHLDGCHEGAVFHDYENFSPLVRQGGLIAFHDCGEPTIFYHLNRGATSTRWTRGGAPDVVECFRRIKKEKEVLQYDQGTGIVYV